MNQIRIAMRAIAFEYNVGECYSHTGDSNRATSFWCSSHSNRGRWIRCTTWRCRFDSLPMRIVCSECNANTAMSFWCECKLNSAMNIAIHIAVAEWDVHVNWIRWIATYRDSTVFTVFTIFSFDANLIHSLVTWVVFATEPDVSSDWFILMIASDGCSHLAQQGPKPIAPKRRCYATAAATSLHNHSQMIFDQAFYLVYGSHFGQMLSCRNTWL